MDENLNPIQKSFPEIILTGDEIINFRDVFVPGPKLGSGIYASTFLVRDRKTGKLYALKNVASQRNQYEITRDKIDKPFKVETTILEILNQRVPFNDNFVHYYGKFTISEPINFPISAPHTTIIPEPVTIPIYGNCIILEYIEGKTIQNEKFNNATLRKFFIWLLIQLKYLDSLGIRHNDLHDGNIMHVNGNFKFIDFGIACTTYQSEFTCDPYYPSEWDDPYYVLLDYLFQKSRNIIFEEEDDRLQHFVLDIRRLVSEYSSIGRRVRDNFDDGEGNINRGEYMKQRYEETKHFSENIPYDMWLSLLEELNGSNTNPDDVRPDGTTNLMLLVSGDDYDNLLKYFGRIKDIDARDLSGRTALHHAMRKRDLRVVEFLVDHGANPRVRDLNGYSPLDYALSLKDPDVITLLRSI